MKRRLLANIVRWGRIILMFCSFVFCAQSFAQAEASKPVVREAVGPEVRQQDLSQLSPEHTVKPWQPGNPVRVVEDLKSSNETTTVEIRKPAVREPVKPETEERQLDELPAVEPRQPGDPVREVDDLKLDEDVEGDSSQHQSEKDPTD